MREIKFRGKRVDNGEWVYGWYIKANGHWNNKGIHEDWIICHAIQNGGWFALGAKYPVIPETVGQYTGWKDRNGVEIYEGDIVACGDGKVPTEIRRVQESSAFMAYNLKRKEYHLLNKYFDRFIGEVIGNIHENPELMED